MSDDSDFQYTDDDIDDSKHSKIVENVLSLNKTQQLKKPSRTEPTLQISEFNLVKSVSGQKGSVQIENLAKVLKTRKKHAEISKKVELTKRKTRTLPKPLEKPQAERIRRSVGYEKNRFLLDRWEAFVTSNRAQAHSVFPLDSVEKVRVETEAANISSTCTYKSNLEKELEKLEPKIEEYHIEDENDQDETPLTQAELKERRRELAKLKVHQSFKEAKARRQNKIKSKKYHRILRKEKIKQKLKEFEELQKTNPEEALKKLEEIEKARALERFSLRHKGTGQWAKSKQVRAKYDRESRQVLAEQLKISRELTQKTKQLDSDSEDEGFVTEEASTPVSVGDNSWVGTTKPAKEVTEFVSSYKKFWIEKNKEAETEKCATEGANYLAIDSLSDSSDGDDDTLPIIGSGDSKIEVVEKQSKKTGEEVSNKKKKTLKRRNQNEENTPNSIPQVRKRKKKSSGHNSSGDWDIEEIFDNAERKIEDKLKKKLSGKDKKSAKQPKKKKQISAVKKAPNVDLSMPSQSKKPIIDEELIEQPSNGDQSPQDAHAIDALKTLLDTTTSSKQPNIAPENFIKPKMSQLDSVAADFIESENEEESSHRRTITMEMFEDEQGLVEDFTKDKKKEVEAEKSQNIDLNLPGWGSWAGTGINPKKQRKRKRFIVKMPEVLPRRDDNKGTLIINEKAAAKVKNHLVSEVPFPFKTVKDFEASIRAPIGNTFVPEAAFERFIRPEVETKMGAVIEPVTTSFLMGKPKK